MHDYFVTEKTVEFTLKSNPGCPTWSNDECTMDIGKMIKLNSVKTPLPMSGDVKVMLQIPADAKDYGDRCTSMSSLLNTTDGAPISVALFSSNTEAGLVGARVVPGILVALVLGVEVAEGPGLALAVTGC
eukprot:gene25953-11635_t